MALHVLLEQRLLVERADAHRAPVPVLLVHHHVLIQVRQLQKLLLADLALERIATAVRAHVLLQLRLLLERLLRALRTVEVREAAVEQQMLVERRDLGEATRTLVAHVLLDLVVGLHVVVEVRHLLGVAGGFEIESVQCTNSTHATNLGKRSAALRFDADERPFAGVQSSMVVQVGDLGERFATVGADVRSHIGVDALVIAQIRRLRESCVCVCK